MNIKPVSTIIGTQGLSPTEIWWGNNPNTSSYTPPKEHAIQGEMVAVTESWDEGIIIDLAEDSIKDRMLVLLVKKLKEKNCIEFTRYQKHETGEVVITARIFATPDSHVRIIRLNT